MTLEYDANNMPVAVSIEYALRCKLLDEAALMGFSNGIVSLVFSKGHWLAHDVDNATYQARLGIDGDVIRILEFTKL